MLRDSISYYSLSLYNNLTALAALLLCFIVTFDFIVLLIFIFIPHLMLCYSLFSNAVMND